MKGSQKLGRKDKSCRITIRARIVWRLNPNLQAPFQLKRRFITQSLSVSCHFCKDWLLFLISHPSFLTSLHSYYHWQRRSPVPSLLTADPSRFPSLLYWEKSKETENSPMKCVSAEVASHLVSLTILLLSNIPSHNRSSSSSRLFDDKDVFLKFIHHYHFSQYSIV